VRRREAEDAGPDDRDVGAVCHGAERRAPGGDPGGSESRIVIGLAYRLRGNRRLRPLVTPGTMGVACRITQEDLA